LLLVACGGKSPSPSPTDEPGSQTPLAAPSVDKLILVTIEGLRSSDLERTRTPRLFDLAAAGVYFTEASSAALDVAAAVTSVMSGLHPAAHGVTGASREAARAAHPELPRLAPLLSANGWRTDAVVTAGHAGLLDLGLRAGFERVATPGDAAACLRAAVTWLGESASPAGPPVMLWLHLDGSELEAIDAGFGELGTALAQSGASGHSLLVIAGVAPRQAELRADLGPLAPVVHSVVATPLIICAPPGVALAGSLVDRPVGGADVGATIAQLTGIRLIQSAGGTSLARELKGEMGWAAPVWIDNASRGTTAASIRWGAMELAAVREPAQARRLHDLGLDGDSQTNIETERPKLAEHMVGWMARVASECAAIRERYPAVAPGP